jgi:hypothetical protein
MSNDDVLTEVIQLIKAKKKDEARSMLEPFLLKNPNHIQAWMWEAELFPEDCDKIKVLEACLKHNPNHPQVIQALIFLKKRSDANKQPAASLSDSPLSSAPPPIKPAPSSSFSTQSFLPDSATPASTPRKTATYSPVVENPIRPQPSLQKNAKPQKKPKRMTPQTMSVIIVLIRANASYI